MHSIAYCTESWRSAISSCLVTRVSNLIAFFSEIYVSMLSGFWCCPRLPPQLPLLASAASDGGSAPCDCHARFRAAFRWLLFRAPAAQIASGFDRFPGCSALTASTVSRPSMLGRTLGARRRAARRKASEEKESEKRREEKRREGRSVAFAPLVDGAPGWALASLGLRGSYRSRGLRPHPAMNAPPMRVVSINTSCASGHSQQRTGGSEVISTAAFSLFVAVLGGEAVRHSGPAIPRRSLCGMDPPESLLLGSMKVDDDPSET